MCGAAQGDVCDTVAAADCGDGKTCMDWQDDKKTQSMGIKCGKTEECDKDFQFGGATYHGVCEGTRGKVCTSSASCDTIGGFVCADFYKAPTADVGLLADNTGKCAYAKNDCGQELAGEMILCTGIEGHDCHSDKGDDEKYTNGCDAHLNLTCADDFSLKTFTFKGSPKCAQAKDCGGNVTGSNGTSVHGCYGDSESIKDAKCDNSSTPCPSPPDDATVDSLACGYITNGTGNSSTNVTHMCLDRKLCADDANTGKAYTYFGTSMTLQCSAVRSALAMGAAVASAYLAM